jgi:Flp pilus assembly protein protease CpaA
MLISGSLLSIIFLLSVRASFIDYRQGILPNRLTGAIFLLALVWLIFSDTDLNILEYSIVICLHFAAVFLPRGAIGAGDAKLIAGLALTTASWEVSWIWLLLAYTSAAFWALFTRKSPNIRFGPWLSAAWFVVGMGQLAHVALAYSR